MFSVIWRPLVSVGCLGNELCIEARLHSYEFIEPMAETTWCLESEILICGYKT
jgi:hypothetical protein